MDVKVTYEFTITNTYTIPQRIYNHKELPPKKRPQITVKNSGDSDTFNNYAYLLEENHDTTIDFKRAHSISPRVDGVNSEKQTFTINTCDGGGMNYAEFRIKMTLGIFNKHGNNGNLANRCKSIVGTYIL